MSKLVTSLVSIAALSFAVEAWSGCCNTCPPAQTVVIACNDGGASAEALVDQPFTSDHSEEALGLATPCAQACKKLSDFGCPESMTPAYGRTCIENCKAVTKNPAFSSYDPACVAKSKSVVEIRKCPLVKCEISK